MYPYPRQTNPRPKGNVQGMTPSSLDSSNSNAVQAANPRTLVIITRGLHVHTRSSHPRNTRNSSSSLQLNPTHDSKGTLPQPPAVSLHPLGRTSLKEFMRRPEKRYVHRVACIAVQVSLSIVCSDCAQSRQLAAYAGPLCRLSNCLSPVIRDGATQELTEYCSRDHMEFVVALRVLVVPWC